jgi:hypothetical protein
MSFDTSTLYVFATMVAGMLGAMLMFFGRQEKIPALKWWGSAYLLGAGSIAIWTVGGARLDPMLSLALNAAGFVACGMVWNASRVFHGRNPNLPGLMLGAVVWVGTVLMLPPADSGRRDHRDLRRPHGGRVVVGAPPRDAKELAGDRRAGDARMRADAADPARRLPAPA